MIKFEAKDHRSSLSEREEYYSFLKKGKRYSDQPHVLLATCDRVEVYSGDGHADPVVAEHLFRVTAGLESPLVGETAIQGQVKRAYETSLENNVLSKGLHDLFQKALNVGKRVRSETAVSRGAMSHALAAVEVIKKEKIDISNSSIVILGVNSLSDTIAKYCLRSGSKATYIGTRTYEKAKKAAADLGCEAFDFSMCYEKLRDADILICATSAPHRIIKKENVRLNKKLLIIDLAVPRDVDPEVGEIEGVKLYNVEDVENLIEKNRAKREEETAMAGNIVLEEVAKYKELICV